MTDITALQQAVLRAQRQGSTDDDRRTFDAKRKLAHDIEDCLNFATRTYPKELVPEECAHVLAVILGLLVKENTPDIGAALLAITEASGTMIEVLLSNKEP